jgi:hypothetical protein
MRLPRVRFTVRRLMIVVVVVALVLEGDSWRRRLAYCRSNAARCVSAEQFHMWMARSHLGLADRYRRQAADERGPVLFYNEQAVLYAMAARGERERAERAADRGRRFRRAAMFPWVSMPPAETEMIGTLPVDRDQLSENSQRGPERKPDSGHKRLVGGT